MTDSPPSPKSLGVGMLIAAWVILLFLLIAYFSDHLTSRYNPNQEPGLHLATAEGAEVRLAPNHQNHYVASGYINGEHVTFLVDTGATDVVIPLGLAKRLNLPQQGEGWATTANGRVKVLRTTIQTLALGQITLQNIRASINPGMYDDTVLLGMSALRFMNFRQDGDYLVLSTAPPAKDLKPFEP